MGKRTRKILRYLLIFFSYGIIFLYTVLFNNSTGWGLFIFLSFFLVFNLLCLLPSLKNIQAVVDETLLCHVNERRELSIKLFKTQDTFFPIPKLTISLRSAYFPIPQLGISFSAATLQESCVLNFFRGKKREIFMSWLPKTRGVYQNLPIEYQAADLFEIFSRDRLAEVKTDMVILPEVEPQINTLLNLFRHHPQRADFGDNRFIIKSFRQYQAGDEPKYIDWKLSAKQQELTYREHESELPREVTLIFWGSPSKFFERTLSIYYTLQAELGKMEPFTQYLFGENIDFPDRTDIKSFALIQPFHKTPFMPKLQGHQLFIFAPEISAELLEQVAVLRQKNLVFVYTYQDLKALFISSLDKQKGGVLDG